MGDTGQTYDGARPQARGAWLEVDLSALRGNLDYTRALVPQPVTLMAVVKADAYGHGMVPVARTALAAGCDWLGVGNLAEGLALRAAGVDAPCLVLAPPLPGDEPAYLSAGLTPSVDSTAGVETLAAAARRSPPIADAAGAAARRMPVHLLVDTGIGRYGVRPDAAAAVAAAIAASPELILQGIYAHFARPADPAAGRQELRLFLAAVAAVERAAGPVAIKHAAGSEAAVLLPEARLDMVRIGNLLYGYWAGTRSQLPATAGGHRPQPAARLLCRVAAVRDVARGQSIGYGGFRAPRAMRIAVLPVGFADGVGLRAVQAGAGPLAVAATMAKEAVRAGLASHRPAALVDGRSAPVVGRVGMQFTLVDVSAMPRVTVGQVVELPGVRATAASALPRVYIG